MIFATVNLILVHAKGNEDMKTKTLITLGVCVLLLTVFAPQVRAVSTEGAVSWFQDQPLVTEVETSGWLVTCCVKIYVSRSWASLKQWQKETTFAGWVKIWESTGGNMIEVYFATDPDGKALAASYPLVGGAVLR